MAKAKNNYINAELDWANQQLDTWKQYVDANPIHELKERMVPKETKNGGTMFIIAETVGQQIKTVTDLMDKYLKLLEVVNNLREKEEQKKMEARGGNALSPFEQGDI